MFPVVAPPMVKVLFRKLWIDVPDALKTKPKLLLVADIVATGAPIPIPVTANVALVVATPPSNRSSLVLRCMIALLLNSVNGDPPFSVGKTPLTSLVRLIRPEVRTPEDELWRIP